MATATVLDRPRSTTPPHLIWWPQVLLMAFILALSVVDAIWLQISGMKLIFGGKKIVVILGFFFAAIGTVYLIFRPSPRFALLLLTLGQLFLFVVPGCVFSYMMMTIGRPLFDSTLASIDMKLGLDWVGYIAFLHQYGWLQDILRWAYQSFPYQIAIISTALALFRRYSTVNRLLASFLIGAVLSGGIGAFYPALGAYHYYHIEDHGISSFIPAVQGLRDGSLSVIDMDQVQGLVEIPSFHAEMSLAFILAAWSLPALRYPVLTLNIVVLLSTPVYGAHYFVDILAGAALVVALTIAWEMLNRGMAMRAEHVRLADDTA